MLSVLFLLYSLKIAEGQLRPVVDTDYGPVRGTVGVNDQGI